MARKGLKRTELKRKPAEGQRFSTFKPRKTWIKHESDKHREKRLRAYKKTSDREKYRASHRTCQCCKKQPTRDIHEIVRQSTSDDSLESRCCWLALCRKCHRRMEDYSDFPIARQCALKKKVDPEGYDLPRIIELRGEAETSITQEQVDAWLPTV